VKELNQESVSLSGLIIFKHRNDKPLVFYTMYCAKTFFFFKSDLKHC